MVVIWNQNEWEELWDGEKRIGLIDQGYHTLGLARLDLVQIDEE